MAAGAAGSQTWLAYIAETLFGQTPAAPQTKFLRTTGNSLALSKQTLTSNELRSDRGIADVRHGNRQVGGDISIEFSLSAFDDFLEAALGGTWTADVLKAGTNLKSFSLERGFKDIAQYLVLTGCVVSKFALDIQPNKIVTGSFSILGKDETVSAVPLNADPTDAPANSPFDSYKGSLKEGGAAIATVTGLQLSLDNGSVANFVLMSAALDNITQGRSNLTGTLSAYFKDASLLNKFLNETESSIEITLNDKANPAKGYTFLFPRVKYMGGDPPVNSEGPIVQSLPFQALLDPVTGTNLQITRMP